MSFIPQNARSWHCTSMLPPQLQVVLFSATFPEKVLGFAQKFAPNSNSIALRHEELTVEGIKQLYIDCSGDDDKYVKLVKLYGLMTIGSSIIFVKVSTLDRSEGQKLMWPAPRYCCRNWEEDDRRRSHCGFTDRSFRGCCPWYHHRRLPLR